MGSFGEFQTEGPTSTQALRWDGGWYIGGTGKRPELPVQRQEGAEEERSET